MNEISRRIIDTSRMNSAEINNNLAAKKFRKESQVSVSSMSSWQSDSSEDSTINMGRKASLQEVAEKVDDVEDKNPPSEYTRRRSMSEGAAEKVKNHDHFLEVFPSLPNSVLEKMGLHGDGPRGRLSEEEIEQKFTSLALAFTIDAATIKDRCVRQRRYRDQTEVNLAKEIERLKEKLVFMQPLCTDYEKAELLSTLLKQIEIVMSATSLVSTTAEKYGCVQYEDRLTESVCLMVNHVQVLKQQRDSARRQLQYTRNVLQNSPNSSENSPTTPQKSPLVTSSRRVMGQRRASVGTFSQQVPDNKSSIFGKKLPRTSSDLSLRTMSSTRNIRPSRLELGGELVKIKEGLSEPLADDLSHEHQYENDNCFLETTPDLASPEDEQPPPNFSNLSLREKLPHKFRRVKQNVEEKYKKWSDDGTIHEVCCFCALLCFSLGLFTMANILVELEYAKRGLGSSNFFWSWTTDGIYDTKI